MVFVKWSKKSFDGLSILKVKSFIINNENVFNKVIFPLYVTGIAAWLE